MNVFSAIYRRNAWNGVESRSGPGSGSAATKHVAQAIVDLVRELGVTSVLNAACGDDYWTPDLPGYRAMDIALEAIEDAERNHPDRSYWFGDVRDGAPKLASLAIERGVTEVLWTFDLVIFRDALQHMSQADGLAALDAIRRSGSHWLLASTFVGGQNVDITTGKTYSPDLMAAPFWMPQPNRLIFDGYGYADPDTVRDPRKHLGLWRLEP